MIGLVRLETSFVLSAIFKTISPIIQGPTSSFRVSDGRITNLGRKMD